MKERFFTHKKHLKQHLVMVSACRPNASHSVPDYALFAKNSPPDCFLRCRPSRVLALYIKEKAVTTPKVITAFWLWATKKIFLRFAYEFGLSHKSRRKPCISSIPQELHIIKTKFCISSLRKEMQPAADDIHLR